MPNKKHTYSFPTLIYYGPDTILDLGKIIKSKLPEVKCALIVTDSTMVQLGVTDKLQSALESSDIKSTVFSDIDGEPSEDDVMAATSIFKSSNADCLIGLGGGSPIDVAKTVKVMATHPAPLSQYDDAKSGDKLIINDMPPFFAIPTTHGTGSEVGRSAIISLKNEGKTKRKAAIFAPSLMPDAAILDPCLCMSLPPNLTATTGIDAFTHCIEAYVTHGFHPLADSLAIEGMRICVENLLPLYKGENDVGRRGQMLMASAMGATAFQKGLGLIHSISHTLGAHFPIHHGLLNAVFLVPVLEFNIQDDTVANKLSHVANSVFGLSVGANATDVISLIQSWLIDLGIPQTLSEYTIPKDQISSLAAHAFTDPLTAINPRKATVENIEKILTKVC